MDELKLLVVGPAPAGALGALLCALAESPRVETEVEFDTESEAVMLTVRCRKEVRGEQ